MGFNLEGLEYYQLQIVKTILEQERARMFKELPFRQKPRLTFEQIKECQRMFNSERNPLR